MHKQLLEQLQYDPETGIFRWRFARGYLPAGRLAGSRRKGGYLQVGFGGRTHTAQRLAWFYVHGTWPANHIDHINRNRSDNRIANLRDVSPKRNAANRCVSPPNSYTEDAMIKEPAKGTVKSAMLSEPTELLALRAPVEFWQRLDKWCEQQDVFLKPSRPAAIRWIVHQFLLAQEKQRPKKGKRRAA
jgi:hypothetical protein